jgi:hypothetical protein
MDKNLMAKIIDKAGFLILHDKSYNPEACQHSPALRDLRRAADLVVGRAKMEESKRTPFSVSLAGSPTKPLPITCSVKG